MKKYLLVLVFISFQILCFAQRPNLPNGERPQVTVTGTIIEAQTKQPLEYATIVFKHPKTEAIITGGITDASGKFSILIPVGMYRISLEFIGFATKTLEVQRITENIDLGIFTLSEDSEALDEVELIAERTTVEIKLDKKIYNVGKDLTVRGGTVSDVLDNVPSVTVDVEGNVSLRGQENVTILINGKPSGLVGLNSTEALRQLPAESIEKVEVITSPSARYDSEGTAGILNIILRRSKLQGLNGAITVNTGYPWAAGVSGNINYRTGNVNIFNTTSYNYRKAPGNSYSTTQYFNTNEYLIEDRTFDRTRNSLNTNFGIEWYVTDNASLTTSVAYRNGDNESVSTNYISQLNSNQSLLDSYKRVEPENEKDNVLQYSLNFTQNFKTSGHKLTLDFQYEDNTEDENSKITQNNLYLEEVQTQEDQNRILLQTDYVLPIGENAQFEMGYRGNFNQLNTDYKVYVLDEAANQFYLDTNVSNNLYYKEYVNAAYTQIGSKINKFSYLLGLRLENTQITIDQETSNDFKKKNYTALFPTVNLNYNITDEQSITLGYTRRIRRPRSWFINPFPSRSSLTSIFQGNPDLDPSYSGQFEIGYLNRFDKLTLNTSVYYQHATNVFTFVNFATEYYYNFQTNQTISSNDPNFDTVNNQYDLVNVIRRSPLNLATENRIGFELNLYYKPISKLTTNLTFNLYQFETKGNDPNGENLGAKNSSWFTRLNTKYTLPLQIDWQTNLFYRGPRNNAQNNYSGIFSADLAFSKDLLKDRASIAFNVRDLFNSRKRKMETNASTFTNQNTFQWRERSFNVSFTYRFNQKKKRERNGRNGGEDIDFEG